MTRFYYSGTNWRGIKWRTSKPVTTLGHQIEAIFPHRYPTDGTVASRTHDSINPLSDHSPDPGGIVRAIDVGTETIGQGTELVESLRTSRDPRLKYVIWQDRMFSSYSRVPFPAWTWRPYSGVRHRSHFHVSMLSSGDNDPRPFDLGELGMTETTVGIQRALNTAGFTDPSGAPLSEDGIWGANTEHAFTTMAKRARMRRVGPHRHRLDIKIEETGGVVREPES